MVKKSVTDEIQAAIAEAKAETATSMASITLTAGELNDLFDMLFTLQKTNDGLVPEPRDFQFQGKPAAVAAAAEARRSIQMKVFELFRKQHGGGK